MISTNRIWYEKTWLSWFLIPLSFLYRLVIAVRLFLYRKHFFKSVRIGMPVVIVGNLTVGGTGKTPFLIALIKLLQDRGYHPGVVSRGYGGKADKWPQAVFANSDPILVGDEPVIIAKNSNIPIFVGPDRAEAAKQLCIQHPACDVILSDDGLQHYGLKRDIEIIVVDGARRFGNNYCLPAGPLREPISRLEMVDFIVSNGKALDGEFSIEFVPEDIINVQDAGQVLPIDALHDKDIVAVAGIGNPDRFFNTLAQLGLVFEKRIFRDHHIFKETDIECRSNQVVVMTEKDAVKCLGFAKPHHWYLKGSVSMPIKLENALCDKLASINSCDL